MAREGAAGGAQAARVDAAAAEALVAAAAWATVAQLLVSAADGLPSCATSWQPQPLPGGDALAALAAGCEDAQPPPLSLGASCAAAAALLESAQRRAQAGDAAAAAAACAAGCALLPRALGALGDTAVTDAAVLRALLPLAHAAAAAQHPSAADEALRCAARALLAPAAAPEASRRAGLALLVRIATAAPRLDSTAADDVALWAAVRRSLFGAEALQRKQALHAVRGALGPSAAGGAAWAELLSLFHGLEDFNMHLLTPAFARMRVLHPAAGSGPPPPPPDVPFQWVSAAWCRACLHDNPAMRRAAMSALGDSEWRGAYAAAMPEADALGPLLRALCDPIHYASGAADERSEAATAFWLRPPPAAGVAAACAARVAAAATPEARRAAARRVVAAVAAVPPSRGGAAALLLVARDACEAAWHGNGGADDVALPEEERTSADAGLEQLRMLSGFASSQWGEAYRSGVALNAIGAAAAMAPPPGVTPAAAARLLAEVARGGARAGAPRAAAAAWLAAPGVRARWLAQTVREDVAAFLEGAGGAPAEDAVPGCDDASAYATAAEAAEWRARARQLALLVALLPSGEAAPPSAAQQRAWGCGDCDCSVLAPLASAAAAVYRRSYPPRRQPQRVAALAEAMLLEASDADEAPTWLRAMPPALLRSCAAQLAAFARATAAPLLMRPGDGADDAITAPMRSGAGGRAYRGGPPPTLALRRAASGRAAEAALAACATASQWRPLGVDDEEARAAWAEADGSLWTMLADVVAAAAWWDASAPEGGDSAEAALVELKSAAMGLVALAAEALASPGAAPPPEALGHAFVPALFAVVAATATQQHSARRAAGDNTAVWRALAAVLRLPGAATPPGAPHAAALGAAVAAVRVTARTEVPAVLRATRALVETLLDAPAELRAAAAAAAAASGEASLADLDADADEDEELDFDGDDAADAPCMDGDSDAGSDCEAALDAELTRCPLAPLCAALSRSAWACVADCNHKWPLAALAEVLATALHPALFSHTHLHARRRGPLRRVLRRVLRAGARNPRLMRLASAAVWALWLRFPEVAARGRYAPEMLRIALYGGIPTDAEASADEPRGGSAAAAAEAFAAMPGGADVAALVALAGEARAARAAAVVGAAALARMGAAGDAFAADAAGALLRRALRGAVAHPDLAAEAYRRNGPTHARKIRLWQLLASLAPVVPSQGEAQPAAVALASFLDDTLWRALDVTNTPCVRQYAERLAAAAVLRAPPLLAQRVLPLLLSFTSDVAPPPGTLVSRLIVAHACARFADGEHAAAALPAVLAAAAPHVTAHNHALRTVAQLVLRDLFIAFPPQHAAWGAGGLGAGAAGGAAMQLRAALCDGADLVAASAAAGPLVLEHPLEACAPARVLAAGEGDAALRLEGAPAPLAERVTAMLDQLRIVTRAGRAAAEGALLAAPGGANPAAPSTPLDALQRKLQPGGGDALAVALASVPAGEASADGGAPGDALTDSTFGAAVTRALAAAGAQRQQLIVVASLVENAPNLGGLARTSEVFRLARLVVADTAVTATLTFKQLAVTADKWLPIAAVSPAALPAYLAARRADGYAIVALEQTTASVPLPTFAWPLRAVLLLGAEGSGVPPNLLALCDACVEIPQLGMIRSLNVHVSGSLAAYSYTMQHALSGTEAA